MAAVAKGGKVDATCAEERENGGDEMKNTDDNATIMAMMSRKEKRKALKKMKRKQLRREKALKEREEEEARWNDPEEQMRLLKLEQEEAERMERDRREFEERERKFLEALELKKKREEEEEERRKLCEESQTKMGENENANELDEDDEWEYVEEGPAEIIWKGNEIIVKKKKVRVRKKSLEPQIVKQESDRPISNPLAPQSEAFEDHKSAQEVLESVAQQVPNFGTEQDKAHCPFHLKTGVCRFGARCSRVHFYPDKSCTLLMKNMYSGPGLAWEQDEGLEYTDEEVERSFEDFYEDVHTEFLKFGEILNFKVCKNSSSHLRGNVYVHYKSLESAVLAYQSINGRYFAGKQISCEFINIMRWKVAICGEYMKSRLKTCSRGSACNFIHCFRNPGGDYEWADWDKPAPRYWVKKMAALFGYASDRLVNEISPSYSSRRSRSRGPDSAHGKSRSDEDDDWRRVHHRKHRDDRREEERHEEKMSSQRYHRNKRRRSDTIDMSDGSGDEERSLAREKRSSRKRERDSKLRREDSKIRKDEADSDRYESVTEGGRDRYAESSSRCSTRKKRVGDFIHDHHWREKDDDFEPREDSDPDRRQAKYHRHRSKHTPHRKDDTDSSDIDSHGDRLDRDKHKHRSRSKRSSREVIYEVDFSDSASDGDTGRDGTRRQKNGRRNSRSKNESDIMNIERSKEKPLKDERHHGHGRRSSSHHNKDSRDIPSYEGRDTEKEEKMYDVEHRPQNNEINKERSASQMEEAGGKHSSCLDSESEREQAYRLAALKKLEKMRKSKDSQTFHDNKHSESSRTHSHDNVGVKVEDVSNDKKELLGSSKVETRAASTKRRRI